MARKVQIAVGKRGGRIAGYHLEQGKLRAEYVSDKPEPPKKSKVPKKKEAIFVHGVRIPPGNEIVWQSPEPQGNPNGLIAILKDSKGRSQYVYTEEHWRQAAAAKWERLTALSEDHERLVEQMEAGMDSPNPRVSQAFEVLKLIADTGIRVGSTRDTKASVKAYGATTLLAKHVRFEEGVAILEFVGKKGVPNKFRVTDKELVSRLYSRVHGVKNPEAPLFPLATDSTVRMALDGITPEGRSYKVKDLRTMVATATALKFIKNSPPPPRPKTPAEMEKFKKLVGTQVASVLGNTAAVALSYYIAPTVFDYVARGM